MQAANPVTRSAPARTGHMTYVSVTLAKAKRGRTPVAFGGRPRDPRDVALVLEQPATGLHRIQLKAPSKAKSSSPAEMDINQSLSLRERRPGGRRAVVSAQSKQWIPRCAEGP